MSNGLDPDQDRHFVSPDLGLNDLQKFFFFFFFLLAVVFFLPHMAVEPCLKVSHLVRQEKEEKLFV